MSQIHHESSEISLLAYSICFVMEIYCGGSSLGGDLFFRACAMRGLKNVKMIVGRTT